LRNRDKLSQFLRGFCMGCADIIPGVSGGTIALVLGIYPRLIESIKLIDQKLLLAIFSGRFWKLLFAGLTGNLQPPTDETERRVDALLFIGFLLTGIATAIGAAAGLITYCRVNYPAPTLGFFLGLVAASLQVPYRHITRRGPGQWLLFILFTIATFLLLGLGQLPESPARWYIFVSAAIAICAMILPGISGAFILLMMGMYDFIVVKRLKPLLYDRQFDGLLDLAIFCLGLATGIIAFSHLLHYLLRRWHDLTMAALLGLMVGSLRVLWPFKEHFPDDAHVRVEGLPNVLPDPAVPYFWPTLLAIGAGFVVVTALDQAGRRHLARNPQDGQTP